jgi:hypothetical protein
VLSQLGSYITGLGALPVEQREHAAAALHNEILNRCTL